jgi:starch-binding outer membrane protein, SusD/RagB family
MNMKKILIIVAGIMHVAGCTKQLEQVNPNAQTSASFWQNQADAIAGVNAAYSSLLPDGGYMRCTPLMLDTRGDDAKSNSPWDQMYNTGKFALNSGNIAIYGWTYETYYQGVLRCNQVLDNVPAINMDAALKDRIIGQAHFMRGLYYYHLVNFFGRVPLVLHVPEVNGFSVPQASVEEGWAQVIKDFTDAAAKLPVRYSDLTGPDKNDIGRATKGAAMAFLGKSLLMKPTPDFTAAAAQFKAVMDLNIYDLVANYRNNFLESTENNIESVFEVQFSREAGGSELGWGGVPQTGWGKTSARAITYAPRGFGWTDVQPTRSVFDEFLVEKTTTLADDPRLEATMFYNKPGMTIYGRVFATYYAGNPADLNDLFCRKYQNDGVRADEFDWRSGINERIMRFADVLLMYAECLNEMNRTAEAYPIIQRVRTRVGLPNLATTRPNMTQAQMRDQIAHERLLEFCLEGHRFDDIRRWGWLKDPARLAILKARDPEFNSYATGREYYPIPQREIDLNPGYTQNAGY